MKAAASIKLPAVMKTKAARTLFALLQGKVREPQILFVGGCVRNAVLNREVSDIDLACVYPPEKTIKVLKAAQIRVIPTGIKHGTVTAIIDGQSFEITTLRRDIKTDGRHAEVEFTDSWVEDAKRRDFTMNTLLADIKGRIFDPLDAGLKDLKTGKVIFVGDAERRIREDYLRILRFFRFHAYYGRGRLNKEGLAACIKNKGRLKTLSKERVTAEFSKIILSPSAIQTLKIFRDEKILPIFHAKYEESKFNYLKLLLKNERYLATLLIISGFQLTGLKRLEGWLLLTKAQRKMFQDVITNLRWLQDTGDNSLKLLKYRANYETARIVVWAHLIRVSASAKTVANRLLQLEKLETPVFPVRGQDLLDQGMLPGPEIKKTLQKLERRWIGNNFEL